VNKLPKMLEKAQKRAVQQTKRKMREQYQIAQVKALARRGCSRDSVLILPLHALFLQRNLTAKNYIKSVAKIMGVDLTPFRD
jgi:hypothetical protein